MKSKIFLAFTLLIITTISLLFLFEQKPVSNAANKIEGEEEEKLPANFISARVKYEFDMVKDPVTGKIPDAIFEKEVSFAKTLPERSNLSFTNGTQRETVLNNYLPAGPNNIGGRTRAVAYDIRYNGSTNRVIIAGCVSGGIMRSADGGNTWTLVTPQNNIHNFTALVQDSRSGFQDIWYAGGGEPFGNSASEIGALYLGFGIWKSTDNGASWTKLPLNTITDFNGNLLGGGVLEAFDNPFDFVHKLAVNPLNGDLYISCHRRLVRSTDGGNNFQTVFGSSVVTNSEQGQTDVFITNAGKILLGVNGGSPDLTLRGVWVSNTGALGSFTRIAGGQTLGVDSVVNWRGNNYTINSASNTYDSRRIIMALAPSDNNIAYVFYENGLSQSGTTPVPEADLFRLDISGNTFTWTNRSANMPDFPAGNLSGSDPLAVQGGYDMVVKVFPSDPSIVYIAGTNLYRSFDGFATTNSIAWINGYKTVADYSQYPNGHADIHELAFNPSNPLEAICGNDGGIQITTNINAGSGSFITIPVTWNVLPNYQTLQYYYVAMDPDAGRNNFAGGAQDNGTNFRDKLGIIPGVTPADSNNHVHLIGGDGCAVAISQLNISNQNQFLYGGSQGGNIQRVRLTNGVSFANIRPNNLTPNPDIPNGFGEFVTNFRIDQENTEDLYYVNYNRLFRTTAASSVTAGGWTELTGVSQAVNPSNPTAGNNIAIRAVAFSRGTYATSHALYIGTTNGKIFRVDDPQNSLATTAPTDITPTSPVLTGNVQNIAVNPNNDDEIMAVVSNYNAISIWWTNNAKSASPNWKNAEGNLTLPSVRSCAIVVKKDASNNPVTEYYVGTSVGLYSVADLGTTLLASGSPTWQREGGAILNFAVVQSITYRPSDNVMLIGTHGNGMFYTFLGTPNFTPNQNTAINPVTNDRNFIRIVYPTLTHNKIQYQTGNMIGIKKIIVQLLDLSGRLVYKKETNYENGNINIDALSSGNYILSIYSDNNKYRHIQKISKQ